MKIVVLMSTYNGEKYLEEQIESILNQQGDFELDLWVRDDGSKDKTITILNRYEQQGKLRWYSGNNLGPARSFLDLIKHCKDYDYYAFSDQDDYWLPTKIATAIKILDEKSGPQLYFANAELVDSNLESLGRNVYKVIPKLDFETLSCAGGILGCTIVFNKELAKWIQERTLPEKVVMHDFYLSELCLALNGEITYDMQPSMKYRQHENNVVGVSHGIHRTIQNRVFNILHKTAVSIALQATEILRLYDTELCQGKKSWLTEVSLYNTTFANRFSLALSKKTRYVNRNMGMKLRLSILLGNR